MKRNEQNSCRRAAFTAKGNEKPESIGGKQKIFDFRRTLVAVIKPFRALRPTFEKAKQVSCVPYDVVHEQEAREFIESNPLSFLHVTRPEAVFPAHSNPAREEVFAKAKENLQKFIDDEIYAAEAEPSFYVYRLDADTHTQTGVVGCCSLDEYELGLIKRHEKTRPDKVEDRTEHMLALQAQTGLIFLAFRNSDKIKALLSAIPQTEPIYDFCLLTAFTKPIWRISRTDSWVEAFGRNSRAYIAGPSSPRRNRNHARRKIREPTPTYRRRRIIILSWREFFPSEDLQTSRLQSHGKDLNGLTEKGIFRKAR